MTPHTLALLASLVGFPGSFHNPAMKGFISDRERSWSRLWLVTSVIIVTITSGCIPLVCTLVLSFTILRVPWTARRSNQSILKEISPEYSLEELTHWKWPWCGERSRQEGKGTTEDEMVGWHHWLDGHEFEQAPGVGDGQGSLVCCSPWDHKVSDTTEWLN